MSNADLKELLDKYLHAPLSVDELHELLGQLRKYENTDALQAAIQQALDDNISKDVSDKDRTDLIFNSIMQQARDEGGASSGAGAGSGAGSSSVAAAGSRPGAASAMAEMGAGSRSEAATAAAGLRSEAEVIPMSSPESSAGSRPRWRWTAAAAASIVIIGGIYLIKLPRSQSAISVSKLPPASNDVAPGRYKAVLLLADSSSIVLDDSDTGMLAQQGSTKILELVNGQLTYKAPAGARPQATNHPLYNVISTPRGGQYQVILPDGSKVWLNAASSLRFPTTFTGKERVVTLTGEAYFDISPSKNMPFMVQAGDTKVEVLGTRFNVMAYENEDRVNTTLLEGSIRVSRQNDEGMKLKPGQQATMPANAPGAISTHEADTGSVVAWKNGTFRFNGNDIQTIMRQMERWYDVDIHYADKMPEGRYSGTIDRDKSLLKVLKIFEEEGDIKFKIEGKNVTIL